MKYRKAWSQLFLFASFYTALTGCTTLYTKGPSAIVESPQIPATGSGQTEFFIRSEPSQYFRIADDVSSRPLKAKMTPDLLASGDLTAGLNFSNHSRWQFGLSTAPAGFFGYPLLSSVSARALAKYQFLGDNYLDSKKPESVASIYSHLIWGQSRVSGDQNGFLGNGGYPWSASAQFTGVNLGASYGYRWSDKILGYLGLAHEEYQTSGEIHQKESVTKDYPAADYVFSPERGQSSTVALGVILGVKNPISFVYSFSQNQWAGFTVQQYFLSVGLSFLSFEKPSPPIQPFKSETASPPPPQIK